MLFSSTIFLFLFLPLLLIIYFFIKDEFKNHVLLIFSLAFYAWGEPKYVFIMLFSVAINYIFGRLIDRYESLGKIVVFCAVISNMGILFYFKYMNFFIDNLNTVFNLEIVAKNIAMPIGISFFTFQAMSYVIDVYRKQTKVQKNLFKLTLYVSFFPQLIAGPIVKYHDICNEIESRENNIDNITYGTYRFITGLAKKIIIANSMGLVADNIFNQDLSYVSPAIAWIGSICYTLQLYYDFSAYSDMAIGLGKMFGFTFLENFNYPYLSKSITEFWRRWHISLGTWFREYLYIPLGGNRKGVKRTYVNLFIVFLVTGFWHGASWTFILWGVWHGIFIVLEKLFKYTQNDKIPEILKRVYTLGIVHIGWVFFRSESLDYAIEYLKKMFFINRDYVNIYDPRFYLSNNVIIIMILGILFSTSICKNTLNFTIEKNKKKEVIKLFLVIVLLVLSISSLSSSTYNPFIYFRF